MHSIFFWFLLHKNPKSNYYYYLLGSILFGGLGHCTVQSVSLLFCSVILLGEGSLSPQALMTRRPWIRVYIYIYIYKNLEAQINATYYELLLDSNVVTHLRMPENARHLQDALMSWLRLQEYVGVCVVLLYCWDRVVIVIHNTR